MTNVETSASQSAELELQEQLKNLEEENELLLLQLHQVQEELENYFLKCQELECKSEVSSAVVSAPSGWIPDEMPETLAEVARLSMLVETQTRLHKIQSQNALNARLGNELIQSVSSNGSLIALPGKLLKIWKQSQAQKTPTALGGENFSKIIAAYAKDDFAAVTQLLNPIAAPALRGKAYTALARHLMKGGHNTAAAKAARHAYEEDPQPYRLKWLAFRLHEANEIHEADACLSLLLENTTFSDSEARQRDQVRYEAKNLRMREAKEKSGFDANRRAMVRQMEELHLECQKQRTLAEKREGENEALRFSLTELGKEKAEFATKNKEIQLLLMELEQKNSDLMVQHNEAVRLVEQKETRIDVLNQSLSTLEHDKTALEVDCDALYKKVVTIEHDNAKLIEQCNTVTELVKTRHAEIDNMHQKMEVLTLENKGLLEKNTAAINQIETLNAEVEKLEQQLKCSQADGAELSLRQGILNNEIVRADAQITLIKEILFQNGRGNE